MFKYIKALIVILMLTSISSTHANAAATVQINDLIEKQNELDGQEVTIQGEAIGESMIRGDHAWININDGSNAIGIWLSKNEAEKVHSFGDYENIGDMIVITGTFNKACKEHGGDTDVHALSVQIRKEGYPVKEHLDTIRMITAIVLFLTALSIFILFLKIQNKARQIQKRT